MKKRNVSAANLAKYKKSLKKRRAPVVAIRSPATNGILRSNPLSNVLSAKLRLSAGGLIDAGASGAIATLTYKINSMFSHQPTGFDQLAVLYQRYRVEKVKVNLKTACNLFTGQSATTAGAYMMGIMITDSSTAPTGYRQPVENGMTTFDLIGVGTDSRGDVSLSVDVPKLLNRPAGDDELSALVTADPAKILYCHLFIQAVDNTVNLLGLGYHVLIEFDAKFLEPVNVAASS